MSIYIASRLLKSRKRQNAQGQGPLDEVLDPVTNGNGSLLGSVFHTLDGLPLVGGLLKGMGILPQEGGERVQGSFMLILSSPSTYNILFHSCCRKYCSAGGYYYQIWVAIAH